MSYSAVTSIDFVACIVLGSGHTKINRAEVDEVPFKAQGRDPSPVFMLSFL